MRGTAATRVKKPRPRTAGVSATEHGRAQAMVEQLQAHVTELEEELEATREGTPSATGEEEIARLKAYIAELEAALDPARDPSDAEVKDALAVLKDPASHNEVQQALACDQSRPLASSTTRDRAPHAGISHEQASPFFPTRRAWLRSTHSASHTDHEFPESSLDRTA